MKCEQIEQLANSVQTRTTSDSVSVKYDQSITDDTIVHELKATTSTYKLPYKSQFCNIQFIDSTSNGEPSGIGIAKSSALARI